MLGCDPRKTRMSCCWINCTWELGVRLRVIEVRVHCDLGSQVHSKIKRRDIVEFWKGTPATGVGLAGAGVWIVDIRLVELAVVAGRWSWEILGLFLERVRHLLRME